MASIKFYLNSPKTASGLKTVPVAINLKFTIDRLQRFEISTLEQIQPKYWDFKKQKPKNSYPGHAELNLSLLKIEQDILQLWRENKSLTKDDLKEKAKVLIKYGTDSAPLQKKRNDLELFIQDFIKKCEEGKIARTPSTIQTYKATLDHLQTFSSYSGRPLTFEAINLDFYYEFCAYSWDELLHEDGTVGKSIKIIKAFMNEAYSLDLHTNISFTKKQFKKLEAQTDSIYLTKEEIAKINQLDLSNRPDLVNSRDLFALDCEIGLRYSDLVRIEPRQIQGNTLRITTKKTREDVVIPFSPIAKLLYNKYNGQFPEAESNQEFNEDLKQIGELAGINQRVQRRTTIKGEATFEWVPKYKMITAHTARRSFATNCYKMGVPTKTIMAITGHKTEKAFNKYIKLSKDEHSAILQSFFDKQSLMKIA